MPLREAGCRAFAAEVAAGRLLAVQTARARTTAGDRARGSVCTLGAAVTGPGAHEGRAGAVRARRSAGSAFGAVDRHLRGGSHVDSTVRATRTADRARTGATARVAAGARGADAAGSTDAADPAVARAAIRTAGVGSTAIGRAGVGGLARVRHRARIPRRGTRIRHAAVRSAAAGALPRVDVAAAIQAGSCPTRQGARSAPRACIVARGGGGAIQIDAQKAAAYGATQRCQRQALPQPMLEGRRCFHLGSATRVTRARTGTRKLTSVASAGNCTRRPAFSRQAPRGVVPIAGGSTLT
jgi:hypothetical protein